MKPRKGRFTLIELLMIISIIIILMSLLMPSLRTGKEKAMQIKCASNMKQIAIATNVYGSDYGYWPAARYPGYIRGNAYWDTPFEYIASYIDPKANQSTAWSSKSPFGYTQSVMELVNCPRARKEDLCGSYTLQYYSSYTVPGGGYALLGGKKFPQPSNINPSSTIYLLESIALAGSPYPAVSYLYELQNGGCMQVRHFRKMNILLADGHVEFKKKSLLKKEQCWTNYTGAFPDDGDY